MLLSFSICKLLWSALAISEVSQSLWILAAEFLIWEDIILISLESNERESNNLMKSVSVLAALLTLLYHHNAFSSCFKDRSRLLDSVITVSPWCCSACGQSLSLSTEQDCSFDFTACDCCSLPQSFTLSSHHHWCAFSFERNSSIWQYYLERIPLSTVFCSCWSRHA